MQAGADAVYPGYGFLSENPALAEACADAGITFVGPTAGVLSPGRQQGPRDRRRQGGGRPGPAERPPPAPTPTRWSRRRATLPFPVFVKAVAGGGGRGMRRVERPGGLREAIETCMREAEGAFGDPAVFIEQAVVDPRHIEVQILADARGRRHPPVRAGLLGAAPPPEGRRDRARAAP